MLEFTCGCTTGMLSRAVEGQGDLRKQFFPCHEDLQIERGTNQRPVFNSWFPYNIIQVRIIPAGSQSVLQASKNFFFYLQMEDWLCCALGKAAPRTVLFTSALLSNAAPVTPHAFHKNLYLLLSTDNGGIPVAGAKPAHSSQFHWSQTAAGDKFGKKQSKKKRSLEFCFGSKWLRVSFWRWHISICWAAAPCPTHGPFTSASL